MLLNAMVAFRIPSSGLLALLAEQRPYSKARPSHHRRPRRADREWFVPYPLECFLLRAKSHPRHCRAQEVLGAVLPYKVEQGGGCVEGEEVCCRAEEGDTEEGIQEGGDVLCERGEAADGRGGASEGGFEEDSSPDSLFPTYVR